jgi:hypothetical protein
VQVLMSAMDMAGALAVKEFVQRFRPPFPVGYNPHTDALAFMQTPIIAPGFVPKAAFIDREGIIREQHDGGEPYFKTTEASVRNTLDAMLAQESKGKKGGSSKKTAPAKKQ